MSLRHRTVEEELLDALPHDDPDAVRSRRDLRRLNGIMGNFRWLGKVLARHEVQSALELGAGDGALGAHLSGSGTRLAGVDFAPRPPDWPPGWDWSQGDLFNELPNRPEEAVVGGHILHHFQTDQLRQLGTLLDDRRLLAFNEPARAWRHRIQGYASYTLGFNHVTRHDMHVSIRAGFRRGELADLLGLDQSRWRVEESHSMLGALRFLARRTDR